ncbi:MAG: carbohydrate kinase family protein [Candidatus Parvarchaeota archaeon]|nr:carbohydrate kinase family protein [Candidatus Parvarchaeota archaeon]
MLFDIVTLGSATKDIFSFATQGNLKKGINKNFMEIPSDKKIDIDKVLEFTGGSATNVAATLAKCGKKTAVIAKIGNDGNSRFILDDLKGRDINTDYIISTEGETPFSNIIVSKNGHMILFVYRGVEKTIKPEDIKLDFDARWLYIGPLGGDSYKILPKIVKYANESGIKIVMNPGSNELDLKIKKLEPILSNIDIISMNDEEARKFVGYGNDLKNLYKLRKAVKSTAIITRGDKGSLIAYEDELYEAGVYPSKQINFVGAGDAFLSGFINSFMDDRDISDAVSFGSNNASSVIKHYGAKDGITNEYPKQNLKLRRLEYEKK